MSATILKIDPYKVEIRILKITNTSKSLQNRKTQMFSQMIDQIEHKNKWYKFGSYTWCYKPLPNVQGPNPNARKIYTLCHYWEKYMICRLGEVFVILGLGKVHLIFGFGEEQ